MKENNNDILNSKKQSWIKPLYTFFVVALPAILIWLFFSNDIFSNNFNINIGYKFLIAFAFLIITFSLTFLLIYFKVLEINTLSFVIPVGVCFMVIFLTDSLVSWARALIILPFIFLVIPINILCRKLEVKQEIKRKIKNKIENEKIIGTKK